MKKENIRLTIFVFILSIIIVVCSFYAGYRYGKTGIIRPAFPNNTTPVEKDVIDTLYLTRDKIITKVEYLDSIKYDTIEKIYVLNDTASVELFYKLVSE